MGEAYDDLPAQRALFRQCLAAAGITMEYDIRTDRVRFGGETWMDECAVIDACLHGRALDLAHAIIRKLCPYSE